MVVKDKKFFISSWPVYGLDFIGPERRSLVWFEAKEHVICYLEKVHL